MKRIKLILFSIICMFLLTTSVNASVKSVDMDIVLDKNGTATVTETWITEVNSGTEGYHAYSNLGKSKIKVISASMDNEKYSVVNKWDEEGNLSSKAYKAGLYKPTDDETDIVFGITNYGNHTYQIVYEITNFVSSTTDADMIYWQLFPKNFAVDNVNIKISGPEDYSDTLGVWGYGKYGALCYSYEGAIYMTTNGKISNNEYLTILAKFPKNTFNTKSRLVNSFNYYKQMADKGSVPYKQESNKKDLIIRTASILNLIYRVLIRR